jgi:hypothetical protein
MQRRWHLRTLGQHPPAGDTEELARRAGCTPGAARASVAVAFGLAAGTVPDRFLVVLAVLGLLAEAA